jgi:hypothetical protein
MRITTRNNAQDPNVWDAKEVPDAPDPREHGALADCRPRCWEPTREPIGFASQFSHVLGVDVPPAFVGRDKDGSAGAIIEFFFDYPNEEAPERFFHASDLLQRSLIDKKRGRPHSLRSNLNICRALQILSAREWWLKTLVSDALIGNTDRHPDNWGFLARVDKDRKRDAP